MSRTDARSTRLRRHPSRTVPATIVAVVLLAIGVLALVATIARLVTGSWDARVTGPAGAVAAATWGSAAVVAASAVALVLGLVLLVAALKPGGHTAAQLAAPAPGPDGSGPASVDYVISNRALARLAVGRAHLVDGVDKVSASATGRRVHLAVTTTSDQSSTVRDRVVSAVTDTLSDAGVRPAPRVSAAVRTKEL